MVVWRGWGWGGDSGVEGGRWAVEMKRSNVVGEGGEGGGEGGEIERLRPEVAVRTSKTSNLDQKRLKESWGMLLSQGNDYIPPSSFLLPPLHRVQVVLLNPPFSLLCAPRQPPPLEAPLPPSFPSSLPTCSLSLFGALCAFSHMSSSVRSAQLVRYEFDGAANPILHNPFAGQTALLPQVLPCLLLIVSSEHGVQTLLVQQIVGPNSQSYDNFWSTEEHNRFLSGLGASLLPDVHDLYTRVGTRTLQQVERHLALYLIALQKSPGQKQSVLQLQHQQQSLQANSNAAIALLPALQGALAGQ
eukprot:763795-Hanusia_phi.AAC.3